MLGIWIFFFIKLWFWKGRNKTHDKMINGPKHLCMSRGWATLTWLVLCVNLMWVRNAQICGIALFLSVSMIMFSEEMSICMGRMRKEDHLYQCEWASSNHLRAWREQKGRGIANLLSLLEVRHSIFSHPQTLVFLVLGTWDSDWDLLPWLLGLYTQTELHHWLSWLSSLHLSDLDFFASRTTWTNIL